MLRVPDEKSEIIDSEAESVTVGSGVLQLPVTVERTCIRLLVMEILSVEVENSIRLFPYETYRRQ